MGIINGQVTDKNNQPVAGADITVMNSDFEPVFSAVTDEAGRYNLDIPGGAYPFFVAVKEYAENYLEYWCNNICLQGELELNCQIDRLEIYGINAFEVKGAAPALTLYFRPMSLDKFKNGEPDIAPDITEESLTCFVNGEKCDLLVMNKVKEYAPDASMTAYLVQISKPEHMEKQNKLDIILRDIHGNMGMGSLFF